MMSLGQGRVQGPTAGKSHQGNGAWDEAGDRAEAAALQVEGSLAFIPGATGRLENNMVSTDRSGCSGENGLSWDKSRGRDPSEEALCKSRDVLLRKRKGVGSGGLKRLVAEPTQPQRTEPKGNGKGEAGSLSGFWLRTWKERTWTFTVMGNSGVECLSDIHRHPCRTLGRQVQILAWNCGLQCNWVILKS